LVVVSTGFAATKLADKDSSVAFCRVAANALAADAVVTGAAGAEA
jgi:hypothetical protein